MQKKKALVIEDEYLMREVTIEYLKEVGYNSFEAGNGPDGVNIYKRHKDSISFILLDIELPVMTAQKALAEIVKINPDVNVIGVTGYINKYQIKEINRIKDVTILKKPYLIKDLKNAIDTCLQSGSNTTV